MRKGWTKGIILLTALMLVYGFVAGNRTYANYSIDPTLVQETINIISANEGGSYDTVNSNDNGALSIGKLQWHAERARNLLIAIRNQDSASFDHILKGTKLYSDILYTSLSTRTLSSSEAALIKRVLQTSASHTVQDNYQINDVEAYLLHGKACGVMSNDALIYFSDLENQGGPAWSLYFAQKALNEYKNCTLDSLYQVSKYNYGSRRYATYLAIKNLKINPIPYSTVNVQLNGQPFRQGYMVNGSTYLHWSVLDKLNMTYVNKGNGLFNVEGKDIKGLVINGETYLPWYPMLSNMTPVGIYGGFNFVNNYSPEKIQINGQNFKDGYMINGNTYIHWSVLDKLAMPYINKGKGLFNVEGKDIQGIVINGETYLPWYPMLGELTPVGITGGFNFVTKYPIEKIQVNGQDFRHGYLISGNTYLDSSVLDKLAMPYVNKGNGLFNVEGKDVQGIVIDGETYLPWYPMLGELTPVGITGGFNFVTKYPVEKIQLNGEDFRHGYLINGNSYLHWSVLDKLAMSYVNKGNGLFNVGGKNIQGIVINGETYLPWYPMLGQLKPVEIAGGFNFVFPAEKIELNGQSFKDGYLINGNTYLDWSVLGKFPMPYVNKGNGLFNVEGKDIQGIVVNGETYLPWYPMLGELTPQSIPGGFNFVTKYPMENIQINGQSFRHGYMINGNSYLHSSVLDQLAMPYVNKGNGLFNVEGKDVQGIVLNGETYLPWYPMLSELTPVGITGGFNFLTKYPIEKIQINGQAFRHGYMINGNTYLDWSVLNKLAIPYVNKGNGVFNIWGRNVQSININKELYLQWNQIAPGKITASPITGGFNFTVKLK